MVDGGRVHGETVVAGFQPDRSRFAPGRDRRNFRAHQESGPWSVLVPSLHGWWTPPWPGHNDSDSLPASDDRLRPRALHRALFARLRDSQALLHRYVAETRPTCLACGRVIVSGPWVAPATSWPGEARQGEGSMERFHVGLAMALGVALRSGQVRAAEILGP